MKRRTAAIVAIGLGATAAIAITIAGSSDSEVGALTFDATHTTATADASPGDGTCADAGGQCSLRAALDEVTALGGQHAIVVSAGTHPLGGPVELDVDLTLSAAPGPTRPVIDLGGSSGFIVKLSMLSVTGIDIENGVSDQLGGSAIRGIDANLIVDDAVFQNHHSDGDGGAINAARGRLAVTDSTFTGNTAIDGGAIAAVGTRMSITTGEFSDNGATGSGGAIAATEAEELVIRRDFTGPIVFERNTALGQGGAVFVIGESVTGSRYSLSGAEFTDNSAGNEGGAVFVGANRGDNDSFLIGTSTFTRNIAVVGGAVGIDFAAVSVESSTFTNNEARGGGGGAIGSGGTLTVRDSEFDGNQVDGNGGAIAANGPLTVVQSEFTGNAATEFGGAVSSSGLVAPVVENVAMNDNEAGTSGGAMFHIGEPFDSSTISGSGNSPSGALVAEPDIDDTAPDPDPDPDPDPNPDPVSSLRSVSPARLVDTRPGESTADGDLAGGGQVSGGTSLRVPVRGRGGVPSSATAVVVNTVAVSPSAPGFLTLYPCDEPVPSTSNVNYVNRPVDVNNAVVKLSADGALCVFSRSDVHVVLDVTAFTTGSEALAPKRLAESRVGERTDDGVQAGFGRVSGGSVTEVELAGRGGVPADAAAVAVNVTAVFPSGPGFLTLYPCDQDRPTASSLNYGPGDVRPNAAVVALSATGTLCVFSLAETDLIVDVTAWFADVPNFTALNPARLLETRPGEQTVDDVSEGIGRLGGGSTTKVQVAGRGGVPAGASAVAVNTAAVFPSGPGFVTLFPCDEDRPTASSLNYVAGDVIANSGVVKLAADGSVCVFTRVDTDLVLDVNAAWTN